MQFVRLVNVDNRPFDFHQSNQKRILPPGAEVMVPWDLACSLFGDPKAVDTTTDFARTRALKQARGLYNYEVGKMTADEWEAIRPKIEVYDVETGDRQFMVLEDPEGLQASTGPGDNALNLNSINVAALEQALAQQQKQIDLLTQLLLKQQGIEEAQGQTVNASVDAPEAQSQGSLPEAEAGDDVPQAVPSGPKPKGKGGATRLAPPPEV